MGVFSRLFAGGQEERAADPSWSHLGAASTASAPASSIPPQLAENLSAVLACVNAIAGGIAPLPINIYRLQTNGREIDNAHPLRSLFRQGPNQWQTWPDFMEWLVASALLRGNGLAEIERDNGGNVVRLKPIPWDWVSVHMLPTGTLAYDVSDHARAGGSGRVRRLLQREVIHLRDRSDDGLLGRSRLSRAASAVHNALSVQKFANTMWENQAVPSGVLQHPSKLSDKAKENIRNAVGRQAGGTDNARGVMILEEGMTWESISLSAEDAELLASRRFTVEELARLYQVPPPIIGDLTNGTFTNAETVGRWFAQQTLSAWVKKIEAELTRHLLADTQEIEIDLSGLLRGDPETRWNSHEIAVRSGILTPNEVREAEGWNRREEADKFEGNDHAAPP